MRIYTYPDLILTQLAAECKKEDLPEIVSKVPEMTKLMLEAKGIGLAANQVGIAKRFCIMSDLQPTPNVDLIINPEIIEASDTKVNENEGCLSLPYFHEKVERYEQVTVKFMDGKWVERKAVFYGLQSRCIQHEIGHLNGELISEKVSVQKKQMWLKAAKKRGLIE